MAREIISGKVKEKNTVQIEMVDGKIKLNIL